MATIKEIYKCIACGNVVEVFVAGDGDLICCGKEMKLLKENTVDAAKEKHIPVIEKIDGGYKVTVGEVAHPMTEEHYIQLIELHCDNGVCCATLKPGDEPVATFECSCDNVTARALCNLHGLWKG